MKITGEVHINSCVVTRVALYPAFVVMGLGLKAILKLGKFLPIIFKLFLAPQLLIDSY